LSFLGYQSKVQIVKNAIMTLTIILSALALRGEQSKWPPDGIKIDFTVNGVSKPCDGMNVQLRVGGKLVPVKLVDGGFIVPRQFDALYRSPETRSKNNISVHVDCGMYPFDFANEYPARLLPGTWHLGVSYPDSWFDASLLESRNSEAGQWLTSIDWECNICEPVLTETQAHFDVPNDISQRFQEEQPRATGERAMAIAFALAVFDVDMERNRDYLLDLFNVCLASPSKPAIEGICDATRLASMLANLCQRGDRSLLRPLMEAAESPAYAADELSYFYADSLERRQTELVLALGDLPISNQKKVCAEAQKDGFRLDGPQRDRVVKQLVANGGEVAVRCLQAIEHPEE
jgi:hypothetical protein